MNLRIQFKIEYRNTFNLSKKNVAAKYLKMQAYTFINSNPQSNITCVHDNFATKSFVKWYVLSFIDTMVIL